MGKERWGASGLIQGNQRGFSADRCQTKIKLNAWQNEFDRPIYFVDLRDTYICSWRNIVKTPNVWRGEGRSVHLQIVSGWSFAWEQSPSRRKSYAVKKLTAALQTEAFRRKFLELMEPFYCPAMNAVEEAKKERKNWSRSTATFGTGEAQTKSTDGSTSIPASFLRVTVCLELANENETLREYKNAR